MRRKIRKIEPVEEEDQALNPVRRMKGVEVKKWCPQFEHRGPWVCVGGLEVPDNVKGVGRELLEATNVEERCDWCGFSRTLDELELRRRLRPIDYEFAVRAREGEIEIAKRSPFKTGTQQLVFLLESSDRQRFHLIGRHKTFCGSPVVKGTWAGWAGTNGNRLPENRCPDCHAEALRITDEQLAVAFAYMLAIGRTISALHPQDPAKQFDPDTGRALIRGEWIDCPHCDAKGKTRPDEADFRWETCEHCCGKGYTLCK